MREPGTRLWEGCSSIVGLPSKRPSLVCPSDDLLWLVEQSGGGLLLQTNLFNWAQECTGSQCNHFRIGVTCSWNILQLLLFPNTGLRDIIIKSEISAKAKMCFIVQPSSDFTYWPKKQGTPELLESPSTKENNFTQSFSKSQHFLLL